MFLRIANIYLIFKHFQQKPKPFRIKINIDLDAISMEKKINIYMAHIWIEHSGAMLSHGPLVSLKKAKLMR